MATFTSLRGLGSSAQTHIRKAEAAGQDAFKERQALERAVAAGDAVKARRHFVQLMIACGKAEGHLESAGAPRTWVYSTVKMAKDLMARLPDGRWAEDIRW